MSSSLHNTVLGDGAQCMYTSYKSKFNVLGPRDKMAAISQTTLSSWILYENVKISIKFSLDFVPEGPINNIPVIVQIMAWRLPGDQPLSEPMVVRLPTYIYVTRPQWFEFFR